MKRLALITAVALVGCGGSDTTAPITNVTAKVTVTLAGAQTGTFTVNNLAAVWASSDNTGGFTFTVAQTSTTPAIVVAIAFPGEPKVGHYKHTDTGANGGLTVNPSL